MAGGAIDLVAVLANSIGYLKRTLLGRRRAGVPHFIRDLIRHSVLWPWNHPVTRIPKADIRRRPETPAV